MKENNKSFLIGMGIGVAASIISIGSIYAITKRFNKMNLKDKKKRLEEEINEDEKTLMLLNKNVSTMDTIIMSAWNEQKLTFDVPKNMTEEEFYAMKHRREDMNSLIPVYRQRIQDKYIRLQYLELKKMEKEQQGG